MLSSRELSFIHFPVSETCKTSFKFESCQKRFIFACPFLSPLTHFLCCCFFPGRCPAGGPLQPAVRVVRPERADQRLLELSDVVGRRYVETSLMGRLSIPEERNAAALVIKRLPERRFAGPACGNCGDTAVQGPPCLLLLRQFLHTDVFPVDRSFAAFVDLQSKESFRIGPVVHPV